MVSNNDIFSELNSVLSQPNMGRNSNDQTHSPDLHPAQGRPDQALVKKLGFRAASLLVHAGTVGPLAAPTRSRDHRFRAELSQLYDPELNAKIAGENGS